MSDESRPHLEAERSGHAHEITALKRKIATQQKIISAMALTKYGFDPDAKRNAAPAKITSDAARSGIVIDQDTVLKHLRDSVAAARDH